jgi:hypothetical protein
MDYFQELLNSYQKIKKRSFRVSYILEQGPEDQKYIQAVQQFPMDPTVPPNTKAKLKWSTQGNVKGAMNANGFKTFETLNVANFPGTKTNRLSLDGTDDVSRMIAIGKAILGAEAKTENEPESQSDAAAQPEGQISPTQEAPIDPHMQEMQTIAMAMFDETRQLIEAGAFVSMENYQGRDYPWARSKTRLEEIFYKDRNSVISKFMKNPEITPQQQVYAMAMLGKYVSLFKKLKDTPDSVSIDEIKMFRDSNLIQFGQGVDINQIRINIGNDDSGRPNWATFRWHKGEGIHKDTGFWKHLGESFDLLAIRRGKELGIDETEMRASYLPSRQRFRAHIQNVGAYNGIVGDVGEGFSEIFAIFLNAKAHKDNGDMARYQETLKFGQQKLTLLVEKHKIEGLKAFRGYESFMSGKMAVTDPELARNRGLSDILEMMYPTMDRVIRSINHKMELGKELSEQEVAILSNAYRAHILTSLAKINMNYIGVMQPKYVVRVGTSNRNGKKTDHLLVYKNEADAKNALRRLIPKDAIRETTPKLRKEPDQEYEARINLAYEETINQEYQKFANNGARVKEMYAGDDGVSNLVQDSDIVIHTGLKTSIDDRKAKVGSASVDQTEKNLITAQTPQMQSMLARIEREHSVPAATVQKIFSEARDDREKITDLVEQVTKAKEKGKYSDTLLSRIRAALKDTDAELTLGSSPSQEQIDSILSDLTYAGDRVLTGRILKDLDGRKPKRDAALAALDGLLSNVGCAEEQAQLMISCSLEDGVVKISDQNGIRKTLIDGIRSGEVEVAESEGGNLSFFRCSSDSPEGDCTTKARLGTLSIYSGGYDFIAGKTFLQEQGKKYSGRPEISQAIRASTELSIGILDILREQRLMLDTLISKYQ